jgi:uncharacterized repeat protein (TIGR01451 family)
MRELAEAVLAVPIAGFNAVSRLVGRSMTLQLGLGGMATALLVMGMLFALPTSQVEAQVPAPFDPAAPTAKAPAPAQNVTIDAPFTLQFSKPMNQGSVADALEVEPGVAVRLIWDSTGKVLNVTPATSWQPFTKYSITVAGTAMDQSGIELGAPVTSSFQTGALTSATISATLVVDNLVAPTSAFQITFSRPVKLATVEARLSISPAVTGTITGDDPTDVTSQVFTFTPDDTLQGSTKYTVSFDNAGGTDAAGVALQPVIPLEMTTMAAPSVVKFRPADGSYTTDPNQVVSVRFTVPMDRASTAAAFSVVVNGKAVRGSVSWAEGDTVLVFDPVGKFPIGSTVTMRVSNKARDKTGMRLSSSATAQFSVRRPTVRRITWLGVKLANSPYYSSEYYYWQLVNCTRTGGWVTSSGTCSSSTHHVMPAQNALSLHAGLSAVARNYSKQLATRGLLTHYLDGTTPHQRLAAAGYPSSSWGENLASPPSVGASGMIRTEVFFQNEYRCKYGGCEFGHYYNIMNPYFHRVGIGIWVANGHVRVTSEFYG